MERSNIMSKITVEAVLKVLEYAALAIYGVRKGMQERN